ncbi:MAG: GtrA family protein [Alloprevotella sp.]
MKFSLPVDKSFLKYVFVGLLNTLVTFLTFALLTETGCPLAVANVLSYAAGILNSFLWNKFWVFAVRGKDWRLEALLFVLGGLLCWGLQWLMFLAVFRATGWPYLAQAAGMGVYTILNYIYNRCVTFPRRKRKH